MRYWPLIVLFLSALNLVADVAARAARPWIAIVVYALCGVAWAFLLGRPGASLVRMVVAYSVLTYIGGVSAGVWMFGEQLTWAHRIGAVLGLVAVLLLGL